MTLLNVATLSEFHEVWVRSLPTKSINSENLRKLEFPIQVNRSALAAGPLLYLYHGVLSSAPQLLRENG